jgi:parallel beta-helix repeat protein
MSAPSREGIVIRSEKGGKISNLTFEHVTIQNCTKNGVLIIGASDIKISRCNFSDNGSSVVPGAGFHHNLNLSYVKDCEITGSRFDTSPFGNGVSVSSSQNIKIAGNEMCRNKLSGIYCADSENITIVDNLAEGNDRDGIAVDAPASGCKTVILQNNLLQHNGHYGIRTKNVAGLKESNNTALFNKCNSSIDAKPAPDPLNPDYANYPVEEWEKPFADFHYGVYQKNNDKLPYRFYEPDTIKVGDKLPLVLLMHGAGERGIDNRYLFFRMKGLPFWETYPCYVLAPQCPARVDTETNADCVWVDTPFGASAHTMKSNPTKPMQLAIELLDSILSLPQIDKSRIYVTGLSMGGFATWELLQRFPGKFAAAAPVCGGGDPDFAKQLVNIPVWAFHGDADTTVVPERSRDMIKAITEAGGNPIYTEYAGVGHGAWTATYANPKLWDWMFSQKK